MRTQVKWSVWDRHAFALAGCLISVVAGCSRESSPPPVYSLPRVEPIARTNSIASNLLPQFGGVQGYAGSEQCRECHSSQYASWHRTFHRTMTQLAQPENVHARFNGVILTNDGARFVLSESSNSFRVRIEAIADQSNPTTQRESVEAPISLVTGSHHMHVFWIPNEMGNSQVGFPFTWLVPEQKWVPRNSTFLRPPDMVHRPETWNFVCVRCHTTGAQPGMNPAAREFQTRVAELGISCEACHGPGERHITVERERRSNPPGTRLEALVDRAIVHPEKIDPLRASQICGYCHSMKWFDRNDGWLQHGFKYRPGDDLEATTPIIRPNQREKQPWLDKILESNPDLLNDFFGRME